MAVNIIEGKVINEGMKVGIVCARFNEFITSKLLGGALDALRRHDVPEEAVTVAWVPSAFEIPVVAQRMAQSDKFDAVICLGAVIRGATSHYDVVCNEVSKGIAQVQLATGTPVMMGVLTVDTIEQAIERAGTKAGNKGFECGVGAIEMVYVLRQLYVRSQGGIGTPGANAPFRSYQGCAAYPLSLLCVSIASIAFEPCSQHGCLAKPAKATP